MTISEFLLNNPSIMALTLAFIIASVVGLAIKAIAMETELRKLSERHEDE